MEPVSPFTTTKGVFAPKFREQMPSDVDLTQELEDEVFRMLQVVEVKDICRKLIGVLKTGKFLEERSLG